MILSMTGYGAATRISENYKVTVELKSLNSKYLEIVCKLPRVYLKYENKLRNSLSRKLIRGKVILLLNIEVLNESKRSLRINRVLGKSYLSELKQFQDDVGIKGEINLEFLLSLPEIVPTEIESEDQEEWKMIEEASFEASRKLIESRKDEGLALDKDLMLRLSNIKSCLEKVEALAPKRLDYMRERLSHAAEEIRKRVQDVDPNRFEQELIFYIEKFDINEEIVRLKQHLNYFDELRSNDEGNGKKLQFLSQEIGREINTIGSKANDAKIQRIVVSMKDELEKIKEQVLNIV